MIVVSSKQINVLRVIYTIITERHLHRILRARLVYRRRYDLDAGIDFIVELWKGSRLPVDVYKV